MVQSKQLQHNKKLALDKATALFYEGKPEVAIILIKKHFGTKSDIYFFVSGWLAQLKGKHENAIKKFEQSLLLNPLNQEALNGLAISYLEVGLMYV